jgi:hypothetical protein
MPPSKNTRISEKALAQLKAGAAARGLTQAQALQQAIDQWLGKDPVDERLTALEQRLELVERRAEGGQRTVWTATLPPTPVTSPSQQVSSPAPRSPSVAPPGPAVDTTVTTAP